jgi:secreted PhoX family phosphatase
VHPGTGEVYFTLTNNSNRRVEPSSSSQLAHLDSANPRVYTDIKGTTPAVGNPNGHILRLKEGTGGRGARPSPGTCTCSAPSPGAPAGINLSA